MHLPDNVAETLGWLTYQFARVQPLLPTYLHLILSALFPVYAGAQASLARPSSAAKPKKRRTRDGRTIKDPEHQQMEGLTASDALVFPLAAGTVLTGLYFLIKWLGDAALLNKILNYYFATFSVVSVAKLVSDGLDVFHSLLFPHQYLYRGRLFTVKPATRTAEADGDSSIPPATTPLPGLLSRLPLPKFVADFAWFLSTVPWRKLTFRVFLRGLGQADAKIGIHGMEGILAGVLAVAYYNFVDKPWWLTNLLGFGFAYGAVQLMSPTTFTTGTLLLSLLFFYDIYFVFFTPMMVTVAQSLDVPIKLLFPRPSRPDELKPQLSMLGLGDVVLPGLMIGLALRFDLYMHYLKKQRPLSIPEPSTSTKQEESPTVSSDSDRLSLEATKSSDKEEKKSAKIGLQVIKAPYVPITEPWGPRLWTSPLARLLDPSSLLAGGHAAKSAHARANAFPQTYFWMSILGYIVGMLATLVAMHVSEHPQPALLYLVPGVLGSLWLTGLARGELKAMLAFSDAEDEEESADSTGSEEKKAREKTDKTTTSPIDGTTDASKESESTADTSTRTEPDAKTATAETDSTNTTTTTTNPKLSNDAAIDSNAGKESATSRGHAKKRTKQSCKLLELAVLLAEEELVYDADGQLVEQGLLLDQSSNGDGNWVAATGSGHEGERQRLADTTQGQQERGHVDKRQRVR